MDALSLRHSIDKLDAINYDLPSLEAKCLSNLGLEGIELRDYQLAGVNWLVERYHRRHGCILGDEMGLGKTCQSISFLLYVCAHEKKRPHLILSPLSVINNWKDELERFTPGLKVISYIGDKQRRTSLRANLAKQDDIDIILSTYEVCLKDHQFFNQFSWSTLIVDEAHRLKNMQSLLHHILQEFDIGHRVLLTGTPVQNNLKELYSLLSFVAPPIFKPRYTEQFITRYNQIEDGSDTSELHQLLRPFLLRRVKSKVLKDLPGRAEVVLFHGLSALQKRYYKALLTRDASIFENGNRTSKSSLMNILMQLRKCVNHPYLFDGVEPEPFQLGEHLVSASGKLALLDQLLGHLQREGHKVLLFSQMTRMLDIIQDYLGYRGYSYERLDGSVRGEERFLAIKNFNNDDDTFIFLLSTRAGGQGLNLVAADTVIFVDSDFNPQNDLQAAARAHRIGQTRCVKVIRLLGRSTVEEVILQRATAKLALTRSVIEGGQFSLGADQSTDGTSLQSIVMFGVDKLLNDDDSPDLDVADLERMLGSSVDGKWQPVEDDARPVDDDTRPVEDDTRPEEEAGGSEARDAGKTLYMFEGRDYSAERRAADQTAVQLLISSERCERLGEPSGGRSRRGDAVVRGQRSVRPPLTSEQREARRLKRESRLAVVAEKAARLAAERQETRTCNKEAKWAANNYTSYNVSEDTDDDTDGDTDGDSEDGDRLDIKYVVGDVTRPQGNADADAIIVHCVADCGRWGSGGLFSAISNRCSEPETQYGLAASMKDLNLGDVHLIPLTDSGTTQLNHSRQDYLTQTLETQTKIISVADHKSLQVALVVAQHRDERDQLSGIKLDVLDSALKKLSHVARRRKASVHLPRIGHNTAAFNWYGTERLIRKHLTSRAVPTSIYYFRRNLPVKRRASSPLPSTSATGDEEREGKKRRKACPLADFMNGVAVYFHNVEPQHTKTLSRYLIAFDGVVHKYIEDNTTHIVCTVGDPDLNKERDALLDQAGEEVKVVSVRWLRHCYSKQQKLDVSHYAL